VWIGAAAVARYSQLGDDVKLLQLRIVDLIRERNQQVYKGVCCRVSVQKGLARAERLYALG
jgi:hypothetical protein